MKLMESLISYLQDNKLKLAVAESCTAGQIAALLGEHEGCGDCLEVGYVVYSATAKKALLGVTQEVIDKFTLTSEAVAKQMVVGAIKRSKASIGIATTGLIGDKPMDGIEPGTVCFAWAAVYNKKIQTKTETVHFDGPRKKLQILAACYALKELIIFYEHLKKVNAD